MREIRFRATVMLPTLSELIVGMYIFSDTTVGDLIVALGLRGQWQGYLVNPGVGRLMVDQAIAEIVPAGEDEIELKLFEVQAVEHVIHRQVNRELVGAR